MRKFYRVRVKVGASYLVLLVSKYTKNSEIFGIDRTINTKNLLFLTSSLKYSRLNKNKNTSNLR